MSFEDNLSCERLEMNIENLPDDCLIYIIEYLPIIDRIRSEAVSRRWQQLIKISWSSFKYLNFTEDRIWSSYLRRNFRDMIKYKEFETLMNRFGKYLRSIDFIGAKLYEHPEYQPTANYIQCIEQYCPKIQSLNLGAMFVNWCNCNEEQVQVLKTDCICSPTLSHIIQILQDWELMSDLKEFGVKVEHSDLNSLSRLISKMQKLKSLHIEFFHYLDYPNINISCWPFNTLNEITIEVCIALEEEFLIDMIKRIKNLRTLVLTDLSSYSVLHRLLPSQYKALENLFPQVYDGTNVDYYQDINIFQNFVNLKRLNVRDNPELVTDEFLKILSDRCRELIFLDISENINVTDCGIGHIVSLPKLQALFIGLLTNVEGKTLKRMANLEALDCFRCTNLEDEGICAIIRQSKLKLINIWECEKITNKFLHAVIEEVNTRKGNSELNVIIDDTRINIDEIEKIPPLLRIQDIVSCSVRNTHRFFDYFPKKDLYKSWNFCT